MLILTLGLFVLGIVAVADSSAPLALHYFSDSFYFVKQQIVWTIVGLIAFFAAIVIPVRFWKKIAVPFFVFNIILLILVLIPGFSLQIYGARRWLSFGPVTVQPSEVLKISLIFLFAKLADDKKSIYYFLSALFISCLLVMLQPDLGTTIVIAVIGFAQMFIAGFGLLWLFGILAGGGLLGTMAILISSYRRQRFLTFLNASIDPLGSSYHIRQVLLALGSGGIFGVGLGQSRQKFSFLPEVATDSVFAIIGEELGFVGAVGIIILFGVFIFKALRIVQNASDTFSKVIATGITAWIGGQVVLNISAMTALVPLTGIPLPFFSYGGSHLTMLALAIGILINISKNETRRA
ncbi:MAG: putative lipid II flippase FtsW [Patescibacteria group bacterium]